MYSFFIFACLMSYSVYANTIVIPEKRDVLEQLLDRIYPEELLFGDSALRQSKNHLRKQLANYFPTCFLEANREEAKDISAFLNDLSCDELIARTANSGLFRFQVQAIIRRLDEEQQISEDRKNELLTYLTKYYGPENDQKAQRREQLISDITNCDQGFDIIDKIAFWNDDFGCIEIIKTAKKDGMTYTEIHEAIQTAFPEKRSGIKIQIGMRQIESH